MEQYSFHDLLLSRKLVSDKMLASVEEARAKGDNRPLGEILLGWDYVAENDLSEAMADFFLGRKIGAILVDTGAVSETDLQTALVQKKRSRQKRFLGDILVEAGVIDEDRLAAALAHQFNLPLFADYEREIDPLLFEYKTGSEFLNTDLKSKGILIK